MLYLKGNLQRVQVLAWLSGSHTGGSRDSRSPSPSSSVVKDTWAGGAVGTSDTPPSSSSPTPFTCRCRALLAEPCCCPICLMLFL